MNQYFSNEQETIDAKTLLLIQRQMQMRMKKSGCIEAEWLTMEVLRPLNIAIKSKAFMATYFGDTYVCEERIILNGVKKPCAFVPQEKAGTYAHYGVPTGSTSADHSADRPAEPQDASTWVTDLQSCMEKNDTEAALNLLMKDREQLGEHPTPAELGLQGIQLALNALAGFFGDDPKTVQLNDWHKLLLETRFLFKYPFYKLDKRYTDLVQSGTFESLDQASLPSVYKALSFASYDHQDWSAMTKRFYAAKNNLALYINCLYYLVDGNSSARLAMFDAKIPVHLQLDNYTRMLQLNKAFLKCPIHQNEIRRVLAMCLDNNELDALYTWVEQGLLGEQATEMHLAEAVDMLRGNRFVTGDMLVSWYNSALRPPICEKLTYYYWAIYSRHTVDATLRQTFSFLLRSCPESYFESILFCNFCGTFDRKEMKNCLIACFPAICIQASAEDYLLIRYLYEHYFEPVQDEEANNLFRQTRVRLIEESQKDWSSNLPFVVSLPYFCRDAQVQEAYCRSFLAPRLPELRADADLQRRYIDYCSDTKLIAVQRWLIENLALENQYPELYLQNLCADKRYSRALHFVQARTDLTEQQRQEKIQNIYIEDMNIYLFAPEARQIFSSDSVLEDVEQVLFGPQGPNLTTRGAKVWITYIVACVHSGEWLKAQYLYAPFYGQHRSVHRVFCAAFEELLEKKHLEVPRSHYQVLRLALQCCSVREYDDFIRWAKGVRFANSDKYKPKLKELDRSLPLLLTGTEPKAAWNRILVSVLLGDRQPTLAVDRCMAVFAYLARYGLKAFDSVVHDLLKNALSKKTYNRYYETLWKTLYADKYPLNVLRLLQPLLGDMPLDFWNVFYDISVCKNQVFANATSTVADGFQPEEVRQSFYDGLLEQYSRTRHTVYLKIAAAMLCPCPPQDMHFSRYVPYCSGAQSKDFLFAALIRCLHADGYQDQIAAFLAGNYWHCDRQEKETLSVLQEMCQKTAAAPSPRALAEAKTEWAELYQPVLRCALYYPEIHYPEADDCLTADEKVRRLRCATLLLRMTKDDVRHVHCIAGLKKAFSSFVDESQPVQTAYLQFMQVLCHKELVWGSYDRIYIRNRYCRLAVMALALHPESRQADRERIADLMETNRHRSLVVEDYRRFCQALDRFVEQEPSARLRLIFYHGIVSNVWDDFLAAMQDYSHSALVCITEVMELSNYRDFHACLLQHFLRSANSVSDALRLCAPAVNRVCAQLRGMEETARADCLEIIEKICFDTKGMLKGLDRYVDAEDPVFLKHSQLLLTAFFAVQYAHNLPLSLANDVRRGRYKAQHLTKWEPVFAFANQLSAYRYLLAVCYAMEGHKAPAQAALAQITVPAQLPPSWNREHIRLQSYLESKTGTACFQPMLTSWQVLTVEENTQQELPFLSAAAGGNASLTDALGAYRCIVRGDSQDQELCAAYQKLFGYVDQPDKLNALYRKLENQVPMRSYDELVLEYGCLWLCWEKQDAPLDVLEQLLNRFDQMDEAYKSEFLQHRLQLAVQYVLGSGALSLAQWLRRSTHIRWILEHPAVQAVPGEEQRVLTAVDGCKQSCTDCKTEMDWLSALQTWRSNWNRQPDCSDYEQSFVETVDRRINQLNSQVQLQLVINNIAAPIGTNAPFVLENGCVFYQIKNCADDICAPLSKLQLQVRTALPGQKSEIQEGAAFSTVLDLRPGSDCGQVYELKGTLLEQLALGDQLQVELRILLNQVVICACRADFVQSGEETQQKTLDTHSCPELKQASFGIDRCAFTKKTKGFGRTQLQGDLESRLQENHMVVLYGSSRVGKSSLLTYLTDTYFNAVPLEAAGALKVCVGTEMLHDYRQHMESGEPLISFANANALMDYLFVAPLRLACAARGASSFRAQVRGVFSDTVKQQILDCLSDSAWSVAEKYQSVVNVLEQNDCQLWLFYDEFQQAISLWSETKIAQHLTDLCNVLQSGQDRINLVLCGSDELVRIAECTGEDSNPWDVFYRSTATAWVRVGALEPVGFAEMMNDRAVWKSLSMQQPWHLSDTTDLRQEDIPPALQTLYAYTGGNAIIGKMVGQELLRQLKNGDFAGRHYLYPADVTRAVDALRSGQDRSIQKLLEQHTTKNLEQEEQYLQYIAYLLAAHPGDTSVTLDRILAYFRDEQSGFVRRALKICVAREILKEASDGYAFTTPYYYDFFLKRAKEQNFEQKSGASVVTTDEQFVVDAFDALDEETQGDVIAKIYGNNDSMNQKMRRLAGSYVQNQTIWNVHARTISVNIGNLFAPNIAPEQLAKELQKLPTISEYLHGKAVPEEDPAYTVAVDRCVYDLQCIVVEGMDQKYLSQLPIHQILGMDQRAFERLCEKHQLSDDFWQQLQFAYQFQRLFEKCEDLPDYSPTAILYCKVVEMLLKSCYVQHYAKALKNEESSLFNYAQDGQRYTWEEVSTLADPIRQNLTIGSFAFPVVASKAVSAQVAESHILALARTGGHAVAEWKQYAALINEIKILRNLAAHGKAHAKVSKAQFTRLTGNLLSEHGLRRLIELADDPAERDRNGNDA